MSKDCIIHNGKFSYQLIVDNMEILFQSSSAADYFEKHYKDLGYFVIRSGNGKWNYDARLDTHKPPYNITKNLPFTLRDGTILNDEEIGEIRDCGDK